MQKYEYISNNIKKCRLLHRGIYNITQALVLYVGYRAGNKVKNCGCPEDNQQFKVVRPKMRTEVKL